MKPRPKDLKLKPKVFKNNKPSKADKLKEYIEKLKEKFKCSCTVKFD